ncbi:tautomerase family protein [Paenibacillus radicis (ex Gao et al. 2016)]|uniref:Tautomerase n=1 Tax=Paenibacillus radicis (ex Gao et al. 2016) TaxID=1737354 RepID=A0A917LYG8_9BACL|nr:tautomerase family protein [Paenibacillus radicis (ex Gao et al. 2016)]GGG65413.1 tautomerase [Paenibacillus radicis (ex Gao et al. 2016)]
MAQIKIYGVRESLNPFKQQLSDIIHAAVVEAFQFPPDKRFHRFFPMDREDFIFAHDRSDAYTIIEISMFEGRTVETKKQLIRLLFQRINDGVGITPQDLEITIFETPKHDWGIRGVPGDELALNYKVNV